MRVVQVGKVKKEEVTKMRVGKVAEVRRNEGSRGRESEKRGSKG